MHFSAAPHFQLGSLSFWASIKEPNCHELLRDYTLRAWELLLHRQECLPDADRLQLIVEAAMEARALFFVAVLLEPSSEDLDLFFDDFVIRSVSGVTDLDGGTLQ